MKKNVHVFSRISVYVQIDYIIEKKATRCYVKKNRSVTHLFERRRHIETEKKIEYLDEKEENK